MFMNYGDVSFFDGGRLVEKIDDTQYEVIGCDILQDDPTNDFRLFDVIYDTDDERRTGESLDDAGSNKWIDVRLVYDYGGDADEDDDYDHVPFILDAISYYGPENFGDVEDLSGDEVVQRMRAMEENRDFEETPWDDEDYGQVL